MLEDYSRSKHIDGLRALAIFSVLGFHFFPNWLKSGFIGVDIFFVISGYLLTNIILNNLDNNNFSYIDFYLRRFKRIFPTLLLLFIVSVLFGWFFLLEDEFYLLSKHVLATIALIPNFIFLQEINYFDNSNYTKPFLHLWSLGVEFQFYIFLPFLISYIYKKKYNIFFILLIVIFISFLINIAFMHFNQQFSFYSSITRLWEFLIGGLVGYYFYISKKKKYFFNLFLKNLLSIIGIILIFFGFFYIKELNFPGYYALLPAAGTALIIISGENAFINKKILSNNVIVWFGLISFPLYLFHWPMLSWFTLINERLLHPEERVLIIIIAILSSYFAYEFLEKKIKKNNDKFFFINLIILILTLVIVSILTLTSFIKPRQNGLDLSKIIEAKTDWVYPGNNFSKVWNKELRIFSSVGSNKEKTLYIGDSNVEQYAARLNYIANSDLNAAVIIGNQTNCHLLLELINGNEIQCKKKILELKKIINDPKVTKIVFAGFWLDYEKALMLDYNLTSFIENEIHNKKKIYFILNVPSGNELDPKNMFNGSRLKKLVPKEIDTLFFNKKNFLKKFSVVHGQIIKIANNIDAEIIDPLKILCPKECPVFDLNKRPLYLNNNHMTSSYSRSSAKFIDKTLEPLN
jgi:peptidoglycan/LPS O-acetylase OafA/YrhL